jgi:hypothetical protein
MASLRDLLRNPFSFFGQRSGHEERLVEYVIREHSRGRSLDEILNDRYLENRTTPQERARLLDRPELIRAVGTADLEAARAQLGSRA